MSARLFLVSAPERLLQQMDAKQANERDDLALFLLAAEMDSEMRMEVSSMTDAVSFSCSNCISEIFLILSFLLFGVLFCFISIEFLSLPEDLDKDFLPDNCQFLLK